MRWKTNTLRSFVTFAVAMTVAAALLGAGLFFYMKSANTLKENYRQDMARQLQQINKQVEDQIHMVDSMYPLIMSNTLIREYLDAASATYHTKTPVEKRLEIERQLSYLLISTYLWDAKLINAVSIFQDNGTYSKVALYKYGEDQVSHMKTVYSQIPKDSVSLEIRTLPGDNRSVYFARNIHSSYTGEKIATVVIDINQENWKQSYSSSTDENWMICIFNDNMQVVGQEEEALRPFYEALISAAGEGDSLFQERELGQIPCYMASRSVESGGITSAVAVPQSYVMRELNGVLSTFLKIFLVIISVTLLFTVILSRAITAPIEKMILHIKTVADGKGAAGQAPPASMYTEFNELADAFQAMLTQLDLSYHDNFQKQLLLKNTEIKALQSQMDPHFLFNILDTVAWKAQMSGNEEIYQMVISLGELLRANILSHEKDFVTLDEEMAYVRFYIYLQQTRFEDKFTVELHLDSSLGGCLVPRFCIQPLVENSVVHGLEPKRDMGKLAVHVIDQGELLEISVADNGVGFEVPEDLHLTEPSKEDSHTHIGMKNLNKRLILLYGPEAGLHMTSEPGRCTVVSFRIPKDRREQL